MASTVINERNILAVVRPLVAAAGARIWVTAPWVTSGAADLFFADVLVRLRNDEPLDVRIVYRLKGTDDLTISDLDALDRLAAAGCQVRYSNRLHAKAVIVDDTDAVISSSNLTSTADYSQTSGPARCGQRHQRRHSSGSSLCYRLRRGGICRGGRQRRPRKHVASLVQRCLQPCKRLSH